MGDYPHKRKNTHDYRSRKNLSNNLKKKIQTTMIGALSSVEKHFGFLWEDEDIPEDKKIQMKNIFEELRSEILDKGNHQLRNVDSELSDYTVSLNDDKFYDITFYTKRGE